MLIRADTKTLLSFATLTRLLYRTFVSPFMTPPNSRAACTWPVVPISTSLTIAHYRGAASGRLMHACSSFYLANTSAQDGHVGVHTAVVHTAAVK